MPYTYMDPLRSCHKQTSVWHGAEHERARRKGGKALVGYDGDERGVEVAHVTFLGTPRGYMYPISRYLGFG